MDIITINKKEEEEREGRKKIRKKNKYNNNKNDIWPYITNEDDKQRKTK